MIREARAASALDHPNIGVIHGLEQAEGGQLFIVMGYYEGETLAQRISRGPLELRESLEVAVQVAGGLAAAHARNIVHRDVKPSNIIITKDGLAKIVDFGLARRVATASATQSLNTSGTLPYMAPEQVLGEPVDQRADVWALGVILLQMAAGSHPFFRENTAAITFAILNQPPAGVDTLPATLRGVVFRALSKEPAYRYSNAKEMLADLEAVRGQLNPSGNAAALDAATITGARSAQELKQFAERAAAPRWQTQPANPSRKSAWLFYPLLAAVVIGATSLLFPTVRQRAAALLSSSGGQRHIAVLPFDNLGNDPANELLAQGLMDSLTGKLSNLDAAQQSLWVVPASVVRSRKVSDPSAAARELGANIVVKGSIQRTGQSVRLTVDLIDTKDLRQIGSASLEDRAGDIATLQDEAVSRLARLMNIHVTTAMLRETGGSVAPAAYESYLKALGYIHRYDKAGNLDLAIASLNSAVQVDPRFAVGYAALGEAYRLKNQVDPNPKWIDEATANCSKAQQLDDRLPASYVTLGRLHSTLGQHDLALQEFQKALGVNPRDAEAITGLAGTYEGMGRAGDAEASYKRAIALRPDYWDGYNSMGMFYTRQNRNQEAVAQFQKVVSLTPDNATAYSNLASAYLNMGGAAQEAEAERALKKSIELGPSYAAYANLGFLFFREKRFSDSAAATLQALQLNNNDYAVWDNLRLAYLWLHESEKARSAADRTLALIEPFVKSHPDDAGARVLLAKLLASAGKGEGATSQVEAALALSPKDPDVLGDAAEAYALLGNTKRAQELIHSSLANGEKLDDLQTRFGLQRIFADSSFRASGKN